MRLGTCVVYEVKLDGFAERCVSSLTWMLPGEDEKTQCAASMIWRSDRERELQVRDAVLDGEIVVMGDGGPKSHALMMNREPASYVVFDLLWLDGRDLRERPLWRRKAALEKLVSGTRVGYVEHSDDPLLMDAVVRMDLEGIVAKRMRIVTRSKRSG